MKKLVCCATALLAICLSAIAARPQDASVEPRQRGAYESELIHYHDSGRYLADIKAVVDRAMAYLARQRGRPGKLALVLDIDETSLSNWPEIEANNFRVVIDGPCAHLPQGPCGWIAWAEMARDRPIAPTLALYRQALGQGLAVFFITGRLEARRSATERNLRAAGYTTWAGLVMRPDGSPRWGVDQYKAAARAAIVRRGYTIVLNAGDQASDLLGGYAERAFRIPNPFYCIP